MTLSEDKHYFDGKREIAIKRDGEKCVSCRLSREEHRIKYGRDITVDHIDGKGSTTPKHLKNNRLSNLQTLCLRCHFLKDVNSKRPLRTRELEDGTIIVTSRLKKFTKLELKIRNEAFI